MERGFSTMRSSSRASANLQALVAMIVFVSIAGIAAVSFLRSAQLPHSRDVPSREVLALRATR